MWLEYPTQAATSPPILSPKTVRIVSNTPCNRGRREPLPLFSAGALPDEEARTSPRTKIGRKTAKKCPETAPVVRSRIKESKIRNRQTMSTTKGNQFVQPYLFFHGNCEEAVEFYRKALGAEVEMTMRYNESPEPPPPGMVPPGSEDKIMHTSFRIGETTVMASDDCGSEKGDFHGFSLSLTVPREADADRVFAALAEGGQVQMPLGKTFWSPRFGMLTDRFGVGWMVSVPSPNQE